jgi:hypothetical protein
MCSEKQGYTVSPNATPVHSVQLDEPAAARLRPYRLDLAKSELPPFAAPLADVIAGCAEREWLEAAALAGYLPYLESLEPTIRGIHEFTVAHILKCEEGDVLGDAIGWAQTADGYRQLIVLLEELAIELERKRAQLHRMGLHALDAHAEKINIEEAAAADVRVIHGRARLALLNLDLVPLSPARAESN